MLKMLLAADRLDLGLERVERVLSALGNPERTFAAVHVAGTNGKGSVCAFLSAALIEAGCRMSMFVSPYLVEPRDAVTIQGVPVSALQWGAACERVLRASIESLAAGDGASDDVSPRGGEQLGTLTTFELWTCAAFLLFAESGVEIAIIEVGLGGRTDSTNVIPTPAVAVITQLGLDHTAQLGPTLKHIGHAKAGIIKRGGRVVLQGGVGQSDAASAEVIRCSVAQGAAVLLQAHPLLPIGAAVADVLADAPASSPLHFSSHQLAQSALQQPDMSVDIPLHGSFQLANASTAIAALQALRGDWDANSAVGSSMQLLPCCDGAPPTVLYRGGGTSSPTDHADEHVPSAVRFNAAGRLSNDVIVRGISRAAWSGRFEVVQLPNRTVILDGGHNIEAMMCVGRALVSAGRRIGATSLHVVYACGATRDPVSVFGALLQELRNVTAEGFGGTPCSPTVTYTSVSVACVPYTTPEGMPWAVCMEQADLAGAMQSVLRSFGYAEGGVRAYESVGQAIQAITGGPSTEGEGDAPCRREALVTVLGSLYLVADTHRWICSAALHNK